MPNPRAVKEISIHALREEGDHRSLFRSAQKIDFYPRPPRGGRPTSSLPSWRGGNFYPRPPRGGRQAYKTDGWVGLAFLSTPSARRATVPLMVFQTPHTDFYPRPPRGGRQEPMKASVRHRLFLSTPSARRATGADEGIRQAQAISIHALREEGDVTDSARSPMILSFLSTPSARRATG